MRPAGPVCRFNSHSSGPGTCLHPSRTQGAKGRRLAPSRANQAPQGTASRQAQAQPAPGPRPGHRGPRAAADRHQVPPKRPVRWARQSTVKMKRPGYSLKCDQDQPSAFLPGENRVSLHPNLSDFFGRSALSGLLLVQAVFVGSGTSRLTEPRLLGRSIHLWSMKYSITRLWSMEATVRSTQYGETNVLHCAAGLSSQTYQRFQMHGKAPRPIT